MASSSAFPRHRHHGVPGRQTGARGGREDAVRGGGADPAMQGGVDRVERGGGIRPDSRHPLPGDKPWKSGRQPRLERRRRVHEIYLAVRLFAALGVPQLVRRGRIVRIFRIGRASAKRVEA